MGGDVTFHRSSFQLHPFMKSTLSRNAVALSFCALTATSPALAGDMDCDQEGLANRIMCWGVKGAIFLVGGAAVISDKVSNAVTPGTAVQVELPDGSVVGGTASRSLLSGRKLVDGKPLRLVCKVREPGAPGNWHALCDVSFPDLPPNTRSIDYYQKTGKQPGFGFTADENGVTEPSLLKLDRPLRWVNGVGI